jgi:putative molybdopterin biosynthesis protein
VADAGLGVRAAAAQLALDFVPLAREPFDLALAAADRARLDPVQAALADPAVRGAIEQLGGYDLAASGEVRAV